MAQAPQSNDSILSVGLDVAEQTEQSVGEIASSLSQEATAEAAPQQSVEDPELAEARELAAAALEQEAAERELAQSQELERDELER